MTLGLASPKQWWQAQVGQFFSMGDIQWGEDLTADEARDATFLLTWAGTWVGKLAYLATDPMTIQEGWWAITQAVTDCWVKVRRPGHPHVNPLAQQPFRFDHLRGSPIKDTSGDGGSDHQPSPHWPPRAKTAIDIGGTKGLCHLGSHHLPQILGLRVTGYHYWQLPWCCPGLIHQMDPSIPDEEDNTRKTELTWR